MSGRSAFDTPNAAVPVSTFTGAAERATNTLSIDHPLARARTTGLAVVGDGIANVIPPLNVWRTSKSDGPQSCSGSTLNDGSVNVTSLEALSLESANVYDTIACQPFESRRVYLACSD